MKPPQSWSSLAKFVMARSSVRNKSAPVVGIAAERAAPSSGRRHTRDAAARRGQASMKATRRVIAGKMAVSAELSDAVMPLLESTPGSTAKSVWGGVLWQRPVSH